MRKQQLVASLCIASLPIVAGAAPAGEYVIEAHGNEVQSLNIASAIRNLVTDRFAARFPAEQYAISVISNHQQLDEDNVCVALVGVAKIGMSETRPDVIPAYQRMFTIVHGSGGAYTQAQRRACQVDAIRWAVKDLMLVSPEEIAERTSASLCEPTCLKKVSYTAAPAPAQTLHTRSAGL